MKAYAIILPAVVCSFPSYSQSLNNDIETITVTATRNNQSLLTLDSNLSHIDNASLALVAHEHVSQALVRVPGGWISRGNGQEHLTAIRSPVLTGAGGCGAFYMAQDGVSLRAPGFCNANQLFDVNSEQAQSIEVLRGPASTLYGSNAVHGVVNILTPNPLDKNESTFGLTFGPHDYMRGDLTVSGQKGDHGFMVYGNGTSDGGYKDDSGFDQQKVNFIHQYQDDNLTIKNVIATTNLNQETAGFITGEEAYKDKGLKRKNPNPEAFRDNKTFRAYSQIALTLENNMRFSVTPYVRWAETTFLQHFLPWKSLEENEQESVGFQSQLEVVNEQMTLLVGLDADVTKGSLLETQAEAFSTTIPAGEHYNYNVDAKVYSPFAKAIWRATERLQLSAGYRYEYSEFDYHNKLSDGSACGDGVENCRFTRPASQKVDYHESSYQLGANYQLTPSHRIYGQFSTGYRAPQATELFRLQAGQTIADLQAEQIKSIEVGVRGQAGSLFYDVNLFSMDKDNFIFQDTSRQNISNGRTSHHGIEFAASYQLPNNFYLKGNGTVANHKYDASLTLSRVDINGNEIDTAPQHMGSMQLGWQENGKLAELEWVHLGNYFLNPENTAEYAGHNLLNLRTKIAINNQLSVSVRLLNITDEDYAERADFGFGSYRYFVGEPRSVFVSANYSFN